MSMARFLSTSWGRKGRKGCTRQVLLAAVAAVAGSILSAPRSFNLWEDLFSSPEKWHDFREHKAGKRVSERHPDFKSQDGQSLWIESRNTPDWVLPKLEESNIWEVKEALVPKPANEDLWQDLLDSPQDWEDFRFDKPVPKFPDFKRTGDQESGLWLNSAPDWVKPKLEEIESKLAPGRRGKARSTSGRGFSSKEHLWRDLFDSPQDWEDFRSDKPVPKFPDFKRTGDQESGLWLNSAPDWVKPKLEEIESKLAPGRRGKARSTSGRGFSSKEHLWRDLFDSPQDWEDFRSDKPVPKFPDFKRTEDKESLWLNSAPDWVHSKLEETEVGYGWKEPRSRSTFGEGSRPSEPEILPKLTDPVEIEQRWEELLSADSEHGWKDYRHGKESGAYYPDHSDFLKPHTGEGLWCDETMPTWAQEKLKEADGSP